MINVTWRGKTYVGTLLDSSKINELDQWAPPRYSDSPSSEVDPGAGPSGSGSNSRTPKGRGKAGRGVKAGGSGGLELDNTRKNLRSSKVKGGGGQPGRGGQQNANQLNSPAKRKAGKDDDGDKSGDEKRRRKGEHFFHLLVVNPGIAPDIWLTPHP